MNFESAISYKLNVPAAMQGKLQELGARYAFLPRNSSLHLFTSS